MYNTFYHVVITYNYNTVNIYKTYYRTYTILRTKYHI